MFTYNLSETEYLVFKTHQDHFELLSGHEGGSDAKKIASYRGGRWMFESYEQKKLFWFLYNIFKDDFGKAFKAYRISLKEKPALYEFSCVRRRFSIKVTKMKRDWNNWFYSTFYRR